MFIFVDNTELQRSKPFTTRIAEKGRSAKGSTLGTQNRP